MDMQALAKDVPSHPDDYQWEQAKRLGVCQPAIHYALKRTHITFKKTLKHPKTEEEERLHFQRRIACYKAAGKRASKCYWCYCRYFILNLECFTC